MSRLLMLDIETAPIDGVEQYLGAIQAPANYTKPESIAKYIEEKTVDEKLKASLDPDLCRIVALAFQWQDETEVKGGLAKDDAEERRLLERFWAVYRADVLKPRVCGYNVSGFDLPVLIRRSQFLGVSHPSFRLGRYAYQMPDVVDLQNVFTLDRHEKFRLRSKDWWLKRLQITNQADNPCTGADVGALIAVGDFETVLAHCKADVANEVLLAQWAGIWA
jgi:predicted PolB exonuclease-like 3'-5' exonuclease